MGTIPEGSPKYPSNFGLRTKKTYIHFIYRCKPFGEKIEELEKHNQILTLDCFDFPRCIHNLRSLLTIFLTDLFWRLYNNEKNFFTFYTYTTFGGIDTGGMGTGDRV